MKRKQIIFLVLAFLLLFGLIPFNRFVNNDTGVKIHQAFYYAVVQKRNEYGDFEFSRIYWFPETLNSDENLHKKALEEQSSLF